MLGLEKVKKSIIIEIQREMQEEEQKLAILSSKNLNFSVSLMDSDIVGLNKKEKNQNLPRLHDRYPASLKNFRYMVLKNQQLRNPNY